MSAPKGHKRYGGRTAGIPNNATKYRQTIEEKCESKGIDVWDAMLELLGEASDIGVKFNILKELAQYLYPKRKALEVSGDLDMRLVEKIKEFEALPDSELKKLVGK